jgi:1-acyl-sn-glycerol-3-phosphate acyltransferase
VTAYIATALYVLIAGPPGLLLAIPFKWKGLLYVLGHGGAALALGLAGIRYRLSGRAYIPKGRAVVFCANHQSNVDPPLLYRALHPRLHILFKAELRKLPILGLVMETGGFVPVDRGSREAALGSIDVAAASLREGNSFLIFPEGTRSKTDQLLPFKKGGFIMAIKAQAPIVPVAITAGAAMRKARSCIWLVSVRVGLPIEIAGRTLADATRSSTKCAGHRSLDGAGAVTAAERQREEGRGPAHHSRAHAGFCWPRASISTPRSRCSARPPVSARAAAAAVRGLQQPLVIGVALALYVIEFVADKVPWVDTPVDTAHTLVRLLGGALIAVSTAWRGGAVGAGASSPVGGRSTRRRPPDEGARAR